LQAVSQQLTKGLWHQQQSWPHAASFLAQQNAKLHGVVHAATLLLLLLMRLHASL
jgi:hypothetical protein